MKKSYFFVLLLVLSLAFDFCGFPTVFAQEYDDEVFMLEEITVTAEKREENLQDASMTINAITGETMDLKALDDLKSALDSIAGVNIMTAGVGAQVFIRGYGSMTSPMSTDMAVGFLIDGVYSGRFQTSLSSMYDMERVEVLRGPQGTLYGRSALAGQINLISKKPTDKFEAGASLTVGNYELQKFEATLNVPLSEKWAARTALIANSRGAYISDGSDTENRQGGRIKLSYDPTDKLNFVFSYEYIYDRANPAVAVPVPGSAGNLPQKGSAPNYGYLSGVYENGWEVVAGGDEWTQDIYHTEPNKSEAKRNYYQVEVNWDLGWGDLVLLPAFQNDVDLKWDWRNVGEEADDVCAKAHYELDQKSFEARLQNQGDSDIQWLLGLYWLDRMNYKYGGDVIDDPLESSEEAGGGWVVQSTQGSNENYAFFGQGTYPVNDQFRLVAGIRYNNDIRYTDYRFANAAITDVDDPYYNLATNGSYLSPMYTDKNEQDSVTYKGGIEYDMAEDSMLYAMITTGFKAGGMNIETLPLVEYKPEKMTAYSVGSKNRFMDQRLQFNAEAFYYNYKDYQVQTTVDGIDYFTGTTTTFRRVINANQGISYGLDLEMDYMIGSNSKFSATFEYLHTEFGSLIMEADSRIVGSTAHDIDGEAMSFSPEWSGTLAYEHNWGLSDGASLTARIDTKLSAGFWASDNKQTPGAWQDSYNRSNFNLNYLSPTGKYDINLWCKNIENMVLLTQISTSYRRVIAAPRTYGVTFSANF